MSSGVIYSTLITGGMRVGSCFKTLRECYEWMREYDAFVDKDYLIIVDLPEFTMEIASEDDWAIALLACSKT